MLCSLPFIGFIDTFLSLISLRKVFIPVLKLFSLLFNIVNTWNWFLLYFFFNTYFKFSQQFFVWYSYMFIFSYSESLILQTNLYFILMNIFFINSKNWDLFKFALTLIIIKGRFRFGLYFFINSFILFLEFSEGDIIFCTEKLKSGGLLVLKSSKDVWTHDCGLNVSSGSSLLSEDSIGVDFILISLNDFVFLRGCNLELII